MRPRFAFDICHEIYRQARELLDHKITTIQLHRASKFLWRPDYRPRLAEFVADFARCGDRALGAGAEKRGRDARATTLRSTAVLARGPRRGRHSRLRASRLILFRLYFLGGAEYHAARRHLGLSELTFADWADEVRDKVGRELVRAGLFPPGKYFHQHTSDA